MQSGVGDPEMWSRLQTETEDGGPDGSIATRDRGEQQRSFFSLRVKRFIYLINSKFNWGFGVLDSIILPQIN